MTAFSIEVPADPRWLHIARSSAIAGVSAMPAAHVDFLDDAVLAIGESVLEVATSPGVDCLDIRVEVTDDRFSFEVTGSGDDVEYEEGDGVFDAVLGSLANERSVRRDDGRYGIRFSMNAPTR